MPVSRTDRAYLQVSTGEGKAVCIREVPHIDLPDPQSKTEAQRKVGNCWRVRRRIPGAWSMAHRDSSLPVLVASEKNVLSSRPRSCTVRLHQVFAKSSHAERVTFPPVKVRLSTSSLGGAGTCAGGPPRVDSPSRPRALMEKKKVGADVTPNTKMV